MWHRDTCCNSLYTDNDVRKENLHIPNQGRDWGWWDHKIGSHQNRNNQEESEKEQESEFYEEYNTICYPKRGFDFFPGDNI